MTKYNFGKIKTDICISEEAKLEIVSHLNNRYKMISNLFSVKTFDADIEFDDIDDNLLKSSLILITKFAYQNIEEMLHRISSNKNQIVESLLNGKSFSQILSLNMSAGDTHNCGHTTAIVTTDAGKFVYKPHDVKVDIFYKDLVNKFLNSVVYVPNSLALEDDNGDFGFCEFVNNKRASTIKDAKKFYYNMGYFLAAAYTLTTNDLHYENILAINERPVLCDLETALMPTFDSNENTFKNNIDKLTEDNVLITDMLPSMIEGHEISPLIKEASTNQSMPMVDDKYYNVYNCLDEFYDGFEKGYLNVLNNKNQILEYFDKCENFSIRIVFRATNFYARVLNFVLNDKRLKSQEEVCEKYKYWLRTNIRFINKNLFEKMKEVEANSLVLLDIPYFYSKFKSTSIYNQKNIVAEDVFEDSVSNRIKDKLNSLSVSDLETEKLLLKELMSNAVIFYKSCFPIKKYDFGSQDKVISYILNEFISLDNGDTFCLYRNKDYRNSFMSYAYYTGYAGLLYLMELYHKYKPSYEYIDKIEFLIDKTYILIDDFIKKSETMKSSLMACYPLGIRNGIAGIIKALIDAYSISPKKRYLDLASKTVEIYKKFDTSLIRCFDIGEGLSGFLYVISKYYNELNITKDLIVEILELIFNNDKINSYSALAIHYTVNKMINSGVISKDELKNLLKNNSNVSYHDIDTFNDSLIELIKTYSLETKDLIYLDYLIKIKEFEFVGDIIDKIDLEEIKIDTMDQGKLGFSILSLELGKSSMNKSYIDKAKKIYDSIDLKNMRFMPYYYHQVPNNSLFNGAGGLLYYQIINDKI